MIALARLLMLLFFALSIIYIIISIRSRQIRKRKLRSEWREKGQVGAEEDFLREGLADYDSSLRKKLILLVYVVPLAVIAYIVYAVNFM
jgi:uncharacterized ion transporter superfamily protein YfcC